MRQMLILTDLNPASVENEFNAFSSRNYFVSVPNFKVCPFEFSCIKYHNTGDTDWWNWALSDARILSWHSVTGFIFSYDIVT